MRENAPILFSVEDQIGKIILNRPAAFNSFNYEMAMQMLDVLQQCKEDKEIRVLYITGSEKAFSSGQDIKELLMEEAPNLSGILTERFNPIVKNIAEMEKPVLAAVNGVAAGAGISLALACDICVAVDTAQFVPAFSKIGLIPDGGATYTLPRLIGWQKATAIMMLSESISAKEAVNMGMIYRTFNSRQFSKASWELAQQLAKLPTKALALTKKALAYSYTNDFDRQLSLEAELQSSASRTADFKEGIQAFAEKREPDFKGE